MRGIRRVEFDYGNTRLHARRGEFLSVEAYERLLGQNIDGVLRALEDTRYAPQVEAVRCVGGLRALHLAVRSTLAGSLEEMRSFYSGRARSLVDALLARFDVQNLISVLRARSRTDTSVEDALAALIPIGWLIEPLTREIMRPHELAGVVDLLVRWMPDRDQAAALRAAYSEYERTDDLPALERAVLAEDAARLAAKLGSAGPDGATLLRFRQRETDEHNLLVALRLRDTIASGADDTPPPAETTLAGGTIPPAALAMIVQAVPATIVAAAGRLGGGIWLPGLERWVITGDLNALQRTLERQTLADAAVLFVIGDPLAIDVPLAFTTVTQVEARNLRLLGEAAARGIPPETVRAELIWPDGRA